MLHFIRCHTVCVDLITLEHLLSSLCLLSSFVLSEDCGYFDLETPDFSLAEETKTDMEEYSQMWGLYEEWHRGFMEKAQEDWITFRYRNKCHSI